MTDQQVPDGCSGANNRPRRCNHDWEVLARTPEGRSCMKICASCKTLAFREGNGEGGWQYRYGKRVDLN